jgi:hypothetical protein
MSSATSIDRAAARDVAGSSTRESRDALRPWHFFVLASLLAATAGVIMARQSRPEHLVVLSLTIGAAGFAGAALYRTLAPLVNRDFSPTDGPLSESLRAVLEREKRLVLRSIKDLEFDKAMGKVSASDFEEMAARLRARAMTLMRQLDAGGGYGELIERELAARMQKATPAARHRPRSESSATPVVQKSCGCGTQNDADAAFCKHCGTKLTLPA